FLGARAARPGFYPYQTPPPPPTGGQPSTAAGEVGVHQERRDAAAAHTAIRRPLRRGGSG
ncbi:MAG: hypothetical protein ACK56I_06895, partial [bacterium]